jgi:hypothetical protein
MLPYTGSGPARARNQPDVRPCSPSLAQAGQSVSNGGVTLTVTAARTVESIDMNQSNFRPGSGYEAYTKTEPEHGVSFVRSRLPSSSTTASPVRTEAGQSRQTCGRPRSPL